MRDRTTSLAAVLLGVLIVALILLAASLERASFTSGRPFDEEVDAWRLGEADSGEMQPLRTADKVFAYSVAAVGFLLIFLFLQRNRGRGGPIKRRQWIGVIAACTIAAVVLLAMLYVNRNQGFRDASSEDELLVSEQEGDTETTALVIDDPLAEDGPPTQEEARPTALLLEIFLVIMAGGVIAAVIFQRLRRRPQPEACASEEILAPVRAAVVLLRQGRDPSGVVEECYRRMLRALAHRSGLNPSALTPREFVQALAGVGISGESIAELSRLFEVVHYGRASERDLADSALCCMNEICSAFPPSDEGSS